MVNGEAFPVVNLYEEFNTLSFKMAAHDTDQLTSLSVLVDSENEYITSIKTETVDVQYNSEGGETDFPEIGKKFKLKKGDALFFNTLNSARSWYER